MNQPIITSFQRVEKKYFLTPQQYAEFTKKLTPYVQADAYPMYTLCNLYYDTDDYRLIRASIEKPIYKEKLRVRSYGVPDADGKVFIEIKKKFDGIVYKRRITQTPKAASALLRGIRPLGEVSQIQKEIEYFQALHRAEPKAFIAYDRQAFQGIEDRDLRITFDRSMRYRLDGLDLTRGDHGDPILRTDDVLMEIKMPMACPLWLSSLLTECGIVSASFSKYGEVYREHILKDNKNLFIKEMRFSA